MCFRAFNPIHGGAFSLGQPGFGLFGAGAVVLAITGGEALYADMGHFWPPSDQGCVVRYVFPAPYLNYLGRAFDPGRPRRREESVLPAGCRSCCSIPWSALSTLATIIASQAAISAFSLPNRWFN